MSNDQNNSSSVDGVSDAKSREKSVPYRGSNPFIPMTFVIVIVALLGILIRSIIVDPPRPGPKMGEPGPEAFIAQGWVNGQAPTVEELKGKVVVIMAWATWCMPCRMHAPELVRDYQIYKDNPDVVFLGLTSDDHSVIEKIESYVKQYHITWRNGYGADETLNYLRADYIPNEWVVGKDGKITWRSGDSGTMIQAIDKALAVQR